MAEQAAVIAAVDPQAFGDGEDELSVGNRRTDGMGDIVSGQQGPLLVAAGAEAALATGETSVEEALVQMYLAGVSVRRVEDITEALWGQRVSPSTVSELNQKIYSRIETWRNRRIEGQHPYVFFDGIWLKRSWGGEVKNIAVLVAIGVREDGPCRHAGFARK